MAMDMGTVHHLHTVTNLRVNQSLTLRSPTEIMPHHPLLLVSRTPTSHPTALQTDTNLVTPFPPSPKKAHRKWRTERGRCQGHRCPVLSEEPRLVHTRLHRFKVNSDITPQGVVWVNIRHQLSQDKWGNTRSRKTSIRTSSERWE